ncbi:MAG: alpha/beta fold hydrolase [Thermomicrobiales bacterium]
MACAVVRSFAAANIPLVVHRERQAKERTLLADRWLHCGNLRYHYRIAAPTGGEGTPLVLVHGLGVSGAYWRRVQPLLAARRPVYAVDLPGFGRTTHPRTILDTGGQAWALADWLAALGLPRAHLMGHSAGGQIVAAFAAAYPERVARLVLVASTIGRESPQFLPHLPKLLHDLLREKPSLLPVLIADGLRAGPWHILRTDMAITRDDTLATVARVTAPLLVIRGTRDTIVSDRETQQLRRAAPHASYVAIPRAPHVVQWSHPHAVAAAVNAFLDDADAPVTALAGR